LENRLTVGRNTVDDVKIAILTGTVQLSHDAVYPPN